MRIIRHGIKKKNNERYVCGECNCIFELENEIK